MNKALEKLLEKHQAIIDAWYAKWHRRQKDRIDGWWLRKKKFIVDQQITQEEG